MQSEASNESQETKDTKKEVTKKDYERAKKYLWRNASKKIRNDASGQRWGAGGKLLYHSRTDDGQKYYVLNAEAAQKQKLFNHERMADSLGQFSDEEIDADNLQLRGLRFIEDGESIRYWRNRQWYTTNLTTYKTQKSTSKRRYRGIQSPDGKKVAYIKDYNLWVRNTETGERTQLTTDGEKNYGYATNNAGWTRSDRPVLLWGPDSEQISTFRHDSRGVGEAYLYTTEVGHPELSRWKNPLPGDSTIFKIERVVAHVGDGEGEKPNLVKLKMDADFHRSTISDHVASYSGRFLDNQWFDNGSKLAFISSSRNHQVAQLRVANSQTGEVRDVLKEKTDTYYESGYSKSSWKVLGESNEVIWFSERDNWGHLYFYDLKSGKLKNQITSGNWRVLDLQYVDEQNRTIYFTGSNRKEGNPYYSYLYKINMDGTGLKNLTPEPMNHRISWSDSKKYFTDTYSTPDTPPTSVVRNTDGEVLVSLGQEDISKLKEDGWTPPEQFTVKARDGKTDLYGMIFKPSNFDPSKSYPVIDYVYPGPQTGSVGTRSFTTRRRDHQALAELGFIVVEVDGMGTPGRSKSFHDEWYGDMGDNTIPDQVAMIKQLAQRHSWMDTTRVGIWGHSGGGNASTRAVLAYPDFFDVAISESGNHDSRNYESDWGDKWHGLLKKKKNVDPKSLKQFEQGDNYDSQANELMADNLKGDLLLIHGTMDTNVSPTMTLLMAQALIKANKDFDMIMVPNAGHGFGYATPYIMNKRWDYFVKHLKGETPPGNDELMN